MICHPDGCQSNIVVSLVVATNNPKYPRGPKHGFENGGIPPPVKQVRLSTNADKFVSAGSKSPHP